MVVSLTFQNFPLIFILKDKLQRVCRSRTHPHRHHFWQQEQKKNVNMFFASSFQDGLCAKPQSSRTTSKRNEDELRFKARNNKKCCSMPVTAENYQLFQVPGLLCIYALCLFFKTTADSRPLNPYLDRLKRPSFT